MTTFDSDQYAKRGSVTAAADMLEPFEGGGRVRVLYAKHTGDTTLAQNDIINLFVLPKNAVPLLLRTAYGAFGANVTLDVGWSGDEDALEAALDVSSASSTFGFVDDATQVTADKIVQAKLEGANPADDKDLEVWLFYVLD